MVPPNNTDDSSEVLAPPRVVEFMDMVADATVCRGDPLPVVVPGKSECRPTHILVHDPNSLIDWYPAEESNQLGSF